MHHSKQLRLALTLAPLLAAHTARAVDQSARTVAIVSADVGASVLVVDQLTAEMSRDPEIHLVEREEIGRLWREQELTGLGITASERVKLGKLVRADILLLVGKNPVAGTNTVRILVCDSVTGARMGQIQTPIGAAAPSRLASEVRNVLARFPLGVRSAVTLPDFLSGDLRLDYAGLQTGLAELLRELLLRELGLALVEFDEAKAISGEHVLAGGEVRRIVPLIVEGEYRTEALAAAGPQISISLKLQMAQREDVRFSSGQIPLTDAGKFLLETAMPQLRKALKQATPDGFDSSREFTQLTQRADRFAELGDSDRAAAVREAALLLKPEANDQRVRLAQDYSSANHALVSAWPKGARRSPDDPFWTQLVAHRRETWRRSLSHVEYLIRNRSVDISMGTELMDGAIHSIMAVRGTEAGQLKEEEELKKEFLRNVASALLILPKKNGQAADRGQRSEAAYRIYEYLFLRMDGNYLAQDDLVLAGDLLCDLLPEDTPLAMRIVYVLGSGTRTFGGSDRDVGAEAWLNFVQRLANSPRPLVSAYGRYARLCDQRIRLNRASEEMLAEAKSLAAAATKPPLAQLDPGGELHRVASDNAVWIEMALRPKKTDSAAWARPQAKEPAAASDGSFRCERVTLKPLEPTVIRQRGAQSSISRPSAQMIKCDELIKAWDGTDVIHSRNSVAFVRKDLVCEEVFVDPKNNIGCVIFDGQYAWVSTGYDHGVYAIDGDGKILASVGPAEGLPEAYATMPLHPLGPGRVLAAGSIGQAGRGWLATITLDAGKPRVNVFHEAIKAATAYREEPNRPNLDPAMSFEPEWIIEHIDEAKKRWLFVGRKHSRQPLVVDLDSLAVAVYPANPFDRDCFPRTEPGFGAFWSQDGLLYVAGSNRDFRVYRFDPQTHHFSQASARSDAQWHYGNATAGCVVPHEGYLYYAGNERWLRHSFTGDHEEVLVGSPRSLPHYGSGDSWRLGDSHAGGLVAWCGGRLYQVLVQP